MAKHQLTLQTLEKLGHGSVVEAFNQALRRAARDCEDNPHEDGKRTVTLQCELEPIPDKLSGCDEVVAKFQIREKLPTRKSRKYSMAMRRDGMLVFNEDSPDDVNQSTFLEE